MTWTMLNSGDRINAQKTKDVLTEIRDALEGRLNAVNRSVGDYPSIEGGVISHTLKSYRDTSIDIIEALIQTHGDDTRCFVNKIDDYTYEQWGDIDDLLKEAGYTNGWLIPEHIGVRNIWQQLQDVIDELKYFKLTPSWDAVTPVKQRRSDQLNTVEERYQNALTKDISEITGGSDQPIGYNDNEFLGRFLIRDSTYENEVDLGDYTNGIPVLEKQAFYTQLSGFNIAVDFYIDTWDETVTIDTNTPTQFDVIATGVDTQFTLGQKNSAKFSIPENPENSPIEEWGIMRLGMGIGIGSPKRLELVSEYEEPSGTSP